MTKVSRRGSNLDWTRDELILALDVYCALKGAVPRPRLTSVLNLSSLLKQASFHSAATRQPNFRSPASVVMKLMNFRSIDPGYGGKGLTAGGRLDREIWREFSSDRTELAKVATAIREVLTAKAGETAPEIIDDNVWAEAQEGAILTSLHRTRERSPRLVLAKKQAVLQRVGRLTCEVCGFCFAIAYGEIGDDVIECHHRRPLSELRQRQRTSLGDLALLCSNCHRMIHWRRPWLTVEQLKAVVKAGSIRQSV
jgi:5-methylcytosine-specific restriction protein A